MGTAIRAQGGSGVTVFRCNPLSAPHVPQDPPRGSAPRPCTEAGLRSGTPGTNPCVSPLPGRRKVRPFRRFGRWPRTGGPQTEGKRGRVKTQGWDGRPGQRGGEAAAGRFCWFFCYSLVMGPFFVFFGRRSSNLNVNAFDNKILPFIFASRGPFEVESKSARFVNLPNKTHMVQVKL